MAWDADEPAGIAPPFADATKLRPAPLSLRATQGPDAAPASEVRLRHWAHAHAPRGEERPLPATCELPSTIAASESSRASTPWGTPLRAGGASVVAPSRSRLAARAKIPRTEGVTGGGDCASEGGPDDAGSVISRSHPGGRVLWGMRKPSEPVQRRESSLKSQTRVVATMPSGEGFALGSVEGRVAVEYVDPSEASQARKFAFKCHRAMVDGADVAYPVNAIAFHPVHGTFATGGADGLVYVWDPEKKKRVSSLKPYPTGVAALAFSPAGDRLAVAASYGYERGDAEHPPDAIHVRKVGEAEVKPKAKAKAK